MIPLLGLLKNPLTKLIAEKTFGAISHKLKKDAIIKQKELDHANNVDIQSLKSSDNSLKDEWLVIVFSLIFLAHFVPSLQDAMLGGWEILERASDYFWIIILTIVGGSFGSSGITKFLKKKK
jgi:general stress protein CsbA|tara:strand:+ start:671 stop:1036 length:366 start_codon:yes stop_codon:yes gene_type:complete